MAEARQRAEWLRVGIAVAWVINRNGWTKDPVHPNAVIPPQFRPPPEPVREKTAEEREFESRLAWKSLDRFLGGRG